MWKWLIIGYLLIINIIGILLMFLDKRRAIKKKWRISEATLFIVAALGGGIGSIIGMYSFRHKTKHKKFVIGMPIITIITYALIIFLLWLI